MESTFVSDVNTENIIGVRISLSNELLLDPRGRSFKEMLAYAESKLTNLYDEHDGISYSEDTQEWNKSFLFSLKNDLKYNFSRERLMFYEKIAKYVLQEKAKQLDSE